MDGATQSAILIISAADWEAIGEDAKHVEDGRYYVLAACPEGPRVVEVQFTDHKPRHTRARSRSG
jgi:hypothetical protein